MLSWSTIADVRSLASSIVPYPRRGLSFRRLTNNSRYSLGRFRSPSRAAHEDEFGTRWTQYHKELRLAPTEGWQTLTLATDEFLTDKGERLKSWRAVDMLELDSQRGAGAEPVFRMFRWVESPTESRQATGAVKKTND